MKHTPIFCPTRLAALALLVSVLPGTAFSGPPAHFWSQRFGAASADHGLSVAADGAGGVFITGYFQGNVNFGGGTLAGAGGQDIFLARYGPAGAHLWSLRFGSTGTDRGHAVAVDGSGNVFVTGYFQGTVDFGGGPIASAGNNDVFLAKYSAGGAHLWSRGFGSTLADEGLDVAATGGGSVVMTGYYVGTTDFGGGPLAGAGVSDIFVAMYNAAGVHQWSRRFGDTGSDHGNGVATDASGNVVITGYYNGTVDFGGGALASAGIDDIFLVKFSPAGAHAWSRRFGGTGLDDGYGVATDAAGNVVVTGFMQETVSFGGAFLASAGAQDIFLAAYDAGGVHRWSRVFGSAGVDEGRSVAVDAAGNVAVTGLVRNTVDFGGGPLTSAGNNDAFIAQFDADGAHRASERFGSTGADTGEYVAVGGDGHVFLAGQFQGSASFGGAVLTASGSDIVLAKYGASPARPRITSIADVPGDEGGFVALAFERSGHDDANSGTPVVQYEVYRRDDPVARAGDGAAPARPAMLDGWSLVAVTPATASSGYQVAAPTVADSTIAGGLHTSVFLVRATTASAPVYFDSPADSGWSVDNLAPGVPGNLSHAGGGVLSWDASVATDFLRFTVRGGDANVFSLAALLGTTVTPSMDVSAVPCLYYFVTASDSSGNESAPGTISVATGTGNPTSRALSVSAFPNPFNPGTTIHYTVPSRGRVTVTIHDARGTRVATLVNGEDRGAGAHVVAWNGRAGGRAASGVYFARVEFNGATRTRKLLLLK